MNETRLFNTQQWAQAIFGGCELGDVRRTRRVVKMAEQLAAHTGRSLAQSCDGDEIKQEGAYRLVRNHHVQPEALMEGGFLATAREAAHHQRLLAIEDTTTLSYRHAVRQGLGELGGPGRGAGTGLWVHSALLVDADSEQTVGLIEQDYWSRPAAQRGQRHRRKERAYADKESYKWQRASERIAARLGAAMAKVITVCDREADVFEYLHYKGSRGERFIVRAAQDRGLWAEEQRLFEQVRAQGQRRGRVGVQVPQRGGRAARQAVLELRSAEVTLALPRRPDGTHLSPVKVNVVLAEERGRAAEKLCWILLTSEVVDSAEQVQDILRCYGLRWRIEEFHKAWKSGAGVEELRMQYRDNLLKMAVMLAFVAVRLLQLREALDNKVLSEMPCTQVLGAEEWKLLWVSTQKRKTLPKDAPTLKWAYLAIAKLGGFTNTKRTGRASWGTMWLGWSRLNERINGYRLLKEATS
jgi:hypothetical protein